MLYDINQIFSSIFASKVRHIEQMEIKMMILPYECPNRKNPESWDSGKNAILS